MSYDSRPDTWAHIHVVQGFLLGVAQRLIERAHRHDASKLIEPERSMFDEFTPKLRDSTYGSEEYEGFRRAMGDALAHHYAENDHHPEHFPSGIDDMNLLQVVEMLCDWKAATLRHADGDLDRSITQNAERFGYDDQFEQLLRNTARDLGWIAPLGEKRHRPLKFAPAPADYRADIEAARRRANAPGPAQEEIAPMHRDRSARRHGARLAALALSAFALIVFCTLALGAELATGYNLRQWSSSHAKCARPSRKQPAKSCAASSTRTSQALRLGPRTR